jgi:hypothetical protein
MNADDRFTITRQEMEHVLTMCRSIDTMRARLEEDPKVGHPHEMTELGAATQAIYGTMTHVNDRGMSSDR